MNGPTAILNSGLLRLSGIWGLMGLFLFGVDFVTVSYIGVTPGGAPFGSPGFWRSLYITSGILIPIVLALFVCGQGPHAPRRLRLEPGGFSYPSLRWVGRRLRPVRVEIRTAGIRRVRNLGLGLYMMEGSSVLSCANGRSSLLKRDIVYVDLSTIEQLGWRPEPYRVV